MRWLFLTYSEFVCLSVNTHLMFVSLTQIETLPVLAVLCLGVTKGVCECSHPPSAPRFPAMGGSFQEEMWLFVSWVVVGAPSICFLGKERKDRTSHTTSYAHLLLVHSEAVSQSVNS